MKVTSAILCASTQQFDRNKVMASYHCSHCKNSTIVQASLEAPYCVHCGSDKLRPTVKASRAGAQLMATKEEALASVKCPGCSTYLMMNTDTLANHSAGATGNLHCPVCASSIAFACNDLEDSDDEEYTDTNIPDTEPKENTTVHTETASHKFVLAKLVKGKPHFITAGTKVLCMVNNICVASTDDLDDVQAAEEMTQGLNAVSETEDFDLEKVLDENEFELAEIDADVEQSLVEEQTEKAEEQVTQETAKLKTNVKKAVCLAMAGVNRNFFDSTNYLQSGLEKALQARGYSIDEAFAIAEEIIEDVSDDYADEIQRIAFDLLAKPEEVRDELETTIASVKPKAKSIALPSSFKAANTVVASTATKGTTIASAVAQKKIF